MEDEDASRFQRRLMRYRQHHNSMQCRYENLTNAVVEQQRADTEKLRRRWMEEQYHVKPKKLKMCVEGDSPPSTVLLQSVEEMLLERNRSLSLADVHMSLTASETIPRITEASPTVHVRLVSCAAEPETLSEHHEQGYAIPAAATWPLSMPLSSETRPSDHARQSSASASSVGSIVSLHDEKYCASVSLCSVVVCTGSLVTSRASSHVSETQVLAAADLFQRPEQEKLRNLPELDVKSCSLAEESVSCSVFQPADSASAGDG